ncbi:hypothetical protein BN2476_360010 [Paraburkholderia piptadeniae]|uniref:Uncharacterized protein n=1 Tax=Paraburkholderia piptadeniae TaxID=1701573 RepID=A0A1N7S8Z4_9BURK|nr:hypothetical protein BN2476_360010 [Paraburkholderia piptadeniae]
MCQASARSWGAPPENICVVDSEEIGVSRIEINACHMYETMRVDGSADPLVYVGIKTSAFK